MKKVKLPQLPDRIYPQDFARDGSAPGPLRDSLLAAAQALAQHYHLAGEVSHLPGGANFIAAVGPWNVVKIFPPFQHFQYEAEAQVLKALLACSLPVPVPQYRADGKLGNWGYVVMSRLAGRPLAQVWDQLEESQRLALLRQIGEVMRSLHTLPAKLPPALDPPWEMFWTHQREHCLVRHRSQGLPAQLLAELPKWLDTHVPELATLGPRVLLTGEYTPENLLVQPRDGGWDLSGMLDFADSMIGPAHYDWVGPLAFLVQGAHPRLMAFLRGYGISPEQIIQHHGAWRTEQLSLLLMHRYSDLAAQLQLPGWETSPSLDALAKHLWPDPL